MASNDDDAVSTKIHEDLGALPDVKYEYLDHTADVQIHAWGDDLKEAFEQAAVAMFGYMTEIDKVDAIDQMEITAEGDDLLGLLYHFLDELLYIFSVEPFLVARRVRITDFDAEKFRVTAVAYGEPFDLGKHPQGTEVKAITYSNMQVYNGDGTNGKFEVFVIIDI